MNRETRLFILGALLFIPSCLAVAICINEMRDGTFGGLYDWFALICSFAGAVYGGLRIQESLEP
jgi:hypothetical protein